MTHILVAAAILAASLTAEPAKSATKPKSNTPATPVANNMDAKSGVKQGPGIDTEKGPDKAQASPGALNDARSSLLGPCTAEMATGKVTSIEVLDAEQINAQIKQEKSNRVMAAPMQRFIKVTYSDGPMTGSSIRQISTHYMLTTVQAQVLVGEKLCVFPE